MNLSVIECYPLGSDWLASIPVPLCSHAIHDSQHTLYLDLMSHDLSAGNSMTLILIQIRKVFTCFSFLFSFLCVCVYVCICIYACVVVCLYIRDGIIGICGMFCMLCGCWDLNFSFHNYVDHPTGSPTVCTLYSAQWYIVQFSSVSQIEFFRFQMFNLVSLLFSSMSLKTSTLFYIFEFHQNLN